MTVLTGGLRDVTLPLRHSHRAFYPRVDAGRMDKWCLLLFDAKLGQAAFGQGKWSLKLEGLTSNFKLYTLKKGPPTKPHG